MLKGLNSIGAICQLVKLENTRLKVNYRDT